MKLNMEELRELSGIPYDPKRILEDIEEPVVEQDSTESSIKALRDTDYRDKEAFFKMTQLLKGLAVASEKDEKAKKYMSAVSDALTSAAKKVLGEELEEADGRTAAFSRMGSAMFRSIGVIKQAADIAGRTFDRMKKNPESSGAKDLMRAFEKIEIEASEWVGDKAYRVFGVKK